jgi:hypothetical protein
MAYVMANSLTELYDNVITVTRKSGITLQTLNNLRKDMHDKWRMLNKDKGSDAQ